MAVQIVNADKVIVAGDDFTLNLTFLKDGAAYPLTGGTATATIKAEGEPAPVSADLTDHAVTNIDEGAGTGDLVVSAAFSSALRTPDIDQERAVIVHFVEATTVVGGLTLTHGPAAIAVRGRYS